MFTFVDQCTDFGLEAGTLILWADCKMDNGTIRRSTLDLNVCLGHGLSNKRLIPVATRYWAGIDDGHYIRLEGTWLKGQYKVYKSTWAPWWGDEWKDHALDLTTCLRVNQKFGELEYWVWHPEPAEIPGWVKTAAELVPKHNVDEAYGPAVEMILKGNEAEQKKQEEEKKKLNKEFYADTYREGVNIVRRGS